MLVITRKVGESFYIGDNVLITILEMNGEKVKVAIDAPREVSVLRKELADVKKLNTEAADTPAEALNAFRKNMKTKENPAKNEKKA